MTRTGTDTYPLGVLPGARGLGVSVVLPFVNGALASRAPFRRSVDVLLGPGQFEPHPPGSGGDLLADYPWELALAALERSPRG